ncbi:MAG TPA: hypothetical protein DCE44_26450 [Verrucomicrobiales bacterium]|nr:hypothetical protein [Verrucomicrobiales bacterium]
MKSSACNDAEAASSIGKNGLHNSVRRYLRAYYIICEPRLQRRDGEIPIGQLGGLNLPNQFDCSVSPPNWPKPPDVHAATPDRPSSRFGNPNSEVAPVNCWATEAWHFWWIRFHFDMSRDAGFKVSPDPTLTNRIVHAD